MEIPARLAFSFLSILLLSGCSGFLPATSPKVTTLAFQAEMETQIEGYATAARVWAREGRIRIQSRADRAFSAMIADYNTGEAWALAPAQKVYQVFSISSLHDRIPHFFDPRLSIEKKAVGREEIDGRMAVKYEARIQGPTRAYAGFLWEAADLPGYPLKWAETGREITTSWKNSKIVELPVNFFQVPSSFTRQEKVLGEVDKGSTCRHREEPPQ